MKLLTYKELGKELSLSVRYLQTMVKQGSIPFIRFGRAIRFDQNLVMEWLKQRYQPIQNK
jgi:excisionase family DNA binding protein